LIALRELALQEVAQEVDRSLETYLDQEGGERKLGVRERFAVAISSNPAAQQLVARAARMAKRMDGELYVVYVDIGVDDNEDNQRTLAANIRFAEAVGAEVAKLKSPTVAKAVAGFVREKHITQVVFGHSAVKGWKRYLYLNAIHKFLRDAPPVDVHIVTQQSS
jgi:two-component system sensor histidine kinase KdpD